MEDRDQVCQLIHLEFEAESLGKVDDALDQVGVVAEGSNLGMSAMGTAIAVNTDHQVAMMIWPMLQ